MKALPSSARAFVLFMLIPGLGWAAQSDLRASLFGEVDQLMAEAREVQAQLLAPRAFEKSMQAYREAEQRLERGQSLDRIQANIEAAKSGLGEAIRHARDLAPKIEGTLKARADAVSSGADNAAAGLFAETDAALRKFAGDLERGRKRDMLRFDKQLASDYRNAELAAIKHRYLADTRKLLAQAETLRAERYAPRTLAQARQLLGEADRALSEDRYDADRPRSLARDANFEALHAIYLSQRFAAIREGSQSNEDLLIEWEQAMANIADANDLSVHFHEGPENPSKQIIDSIRSLQARNADLTATLSDRDQQIIQMGIEIRDLEQRLGGVARERSVLQEELARQEQVRRRFMQVEGLFEPQEEAQVIREADKVTLRLVGLTFDVGESTIKAENFPLLTKVQSAIRIFPRPQLIVEGHTDSFGSDQNNLDLSQDRAESVRQYLMANMRLGPQQITATGYGEARPIANNETREGRARNRRIDLVIIPGE